MASNASKNTTSTSSSAKPKPAGAKSKLMIDQGLRLGNGVIHLISERGEQIFNQRLFCLGCGIGYEPLDPRLFSFNSQQGACAQCAGMGFTWDFDPDLIFADPRRPLRDAIGGISPGSSVNGSETERALQRLLHDLKDKHRVDVDKPFRQIAENQLGRKFFTAAAAAKAFVGLVPFLKELSAASDENSASELDELMTEMHLPGLQRPALNQRAQAVKVAREDDLASRPLIRRGCERAISTSSIFPTPTMATSARDQAVADKILREIQQRLNFLAEVGLPYLTLDRRADTLSGGEAQRIRLAAQFGSNLRGVCYILDEPTIGLHPRDNAMLLSTLRRLEQLGNSVLVVEHDEATIQSADLGRRPRTRRRRAWRQRRRHRHAGRNKKQSRLAHRRLPPIGQTKARPEA